MSDNPALPDGIVLQHTLYGQPATGVTHAWTATVGGVEVQLAPYGGVPYVDPDPGPPPPVPRLPEPEDRPEHRVGFCLAKQDTCGARAVKGHDLCIFHYKQAQTHPERL